MTEVYLHPEFIEKILDDHKDLLEYAYLVAIRHKDINVGLQVIKDFFNATSNDDNSVVH